MKRIPLLLCLLSGSAVAGEKMAPLYVSPDLVRGATPRPAAAPGSQGGVAVTYPVSPSPPVEVQAGAPAPGRGESAATPAGATPKAVTAAPGAAPTVPAPSVAAPKSPAVPGPVAQPATPATPPAAPPVAGKPAPGDTFIEARTMSGTQDVEVVADGEAVLLRGDMKVEADRLTYRELTDEAEAEGNVHITQGAESSVRGPRARILVGPQTGEFEAPVYSFSHTSKPAPGEKAETVTGSGHADTLYFEGENHYRLANATWTTCKPDDPDWYFKSAEMKLDYDREVGVAKDSTLVFKDVPLLYMPWADFPLAKQRQSGFLAPSFGTSTKTGLDVSAPYYWNLAPNYDATLTPRYMGTRGLQLGGEFRYLTQAYAGTSRVEYMPKDDETGGARAAGSIQHMQTFMPGLSGALNLNAVSDTQYFSDLSTHLANVSRVNLVREGSLTYGGGDWWNVTGRMQSFQTLSGDKPYRRLPQVIFNAAQPQSFLGTSASFLGDYTQFDHPDAGKTQGSRMVMYPQLALPIETAYFSLTPKVGVHYTQYDLTQPVSQGSATSFSRTLPIATVEGSVVFERDWSLGGRDYLQTLEPRLYYVYIPFEKQDPSKYPIFDTAYYDFNFAQIFTENIFSGQDRVSNANQLTAALTSRLIDPATGAQVMKAAVGQRYYFADQRVLLNSNDTARTGKRADIVAAFGGEVAPKTTLDTGWQYNPNDSNTERFDFNLRWQPEVAKALGVAWRFKANSASSNPDNPDGYRDIDFTGQWPLWGRWYGVGRYDRSLQDHRVTEAIAGLEYNGGCWVLRTAVHQYVNSKNNQQSSSVNNSDTTTAFFVQLEFSGLTSLGSSPVSLLRRSVPGYGNISDGRLFDDNNE